MIRSYGVAAEVLAAGAVILAPAPDAQAASHAAALACDADQIRDDFSINSAADPRLTDRIVTLGNAGLNVYVSLEADGGETDANVRQHTEDLATCLPDGRLGKLVVYYDSKSQLLDISATPEDDYISLERQDEAADAMATVLGQPETPFQDDALTAIEVATQDILLPGDDNTGSNDGVPDQQPQDTPEIARKPIHIDIPWRNVLAGTAVTLMAGAAGARIFRGSRVNALGLTANQQIERSRNATAAIIGRISELHISPGDSTRQADDTDPEAMKLKLQLDGVLTNLTLLSGKRRFGIIPTGKPAVDPTAERPSLGTRLRQKLWPDLAASKLRAARAAALSNKASALMSQLEPRLQRNELAYSTYDDNLATINRVNGELAELRGRFAGTVLAGAEPSASELAVAPAAISAHKENGYPLQSAIAALDLAESRQALNEQLQALPALHTHAMTTLARLGREYSAACTQPLQAQQAAIKRQLATLVAWNTTDARPQDTPADTVPAFTQELATLTAALANIEAHAVELDGLRSNLPIAANTFRDEWQQINAFIAANPGDFQDDNQAAALAYGRVVQQFVAKLKPDDGNKPDYLSLSQQLEASKEAWQTVAGNIRADKAEMDNLREQCAQLEEQAQLDTAALKAMLANNRTDIDYETTQLINTIMAPAHRTARSREELRTWQAQLTAFIRKVSTAHHEGSEDIKHAQQLRDLAEAASRPAPSPSPRRGDSGHSVRRVSSPPAPTRSGHSVRRVG